MHKHIKKRDIVFGIAILLLLFVIIYSGLRIFMPAVSIPSDDGSGKTIERDGKKYFPRQDMTVFMIMGIDKEGVVEASGSYNNDGEADVVVLAVFDETDKTYSLLCLNRDTMLEMPVLGIGGKQAGTVTAQLALSHTYGSGLEDSCENTRKTVSDFLYGLDIDYYFAFNMDAVGILNDSVGGVKVDVKDDFSEIDPTIKMGENILNAEQAMNFIRVRKGLGDQMNLSRIERHKAYMQGFFDALGAKLRTDEGFVIGTYSDIEKYMVTDCSVDTMGALAGRYSEYTLKEIVSPEGENVIGDEFVEFYADEASLDELILRMFYAEKK